jgi:beta-glucanase (GH16 family)
MRCLLLASPVILAASSIFAIEQGPSDTLPPPPAGKAWKLVWHDEFDGERLDETKWRIAHDGPRRDGWWTRSAISLDGQGHLVIQTRKDGDKYIDGCVDTQGKFEHSFGYYVARIQLQRQPGHWSAFWLMGPGVSKVGNEGRDGTEIDIYEKPWLDDRVQQTFHWDGYGKDHKTAGKVVRVPGVMDGFHTFGLWWKPDEYVLYVDGKETWQTSAGGVSQVPEHIKLSDEIGKWAGDIGKAKLPDATLVDYVRVYDLVDVDYAEISPQRVEELSATLPAKPSGFGRPWSDRNYWNYASRQKGLAATIPEAEKLLRADFPRWDDDAYLDFSRTGRRQIGEAMMSRRSAWLAPLVLAECLENSRRFVDRIDMILKEYVREPTWTWPAHDGALKNFHRLQYSVDLRSATLAHELAQALYLLGDKVPSSTRRDVEAALKERVFTPVADSIRSGKGNSWLQIKNNWNAVCLAGVTGAALATIADRRERAEFVAAAEHYAKNFLAGFADDGYCSEGVGYWNYGFGHFALLRDELLAATAGRIDLFGDQKIRNIALFGLRIQMIPGNSPAFGDCHLGVVPDALLVAYCNRALGLRLNLPDEEAPVNHSSLVAACREPAIPVSSGTAHGEADPVGLRSYFDNAGVLICRPLPDSSSPLAVAIKAGGNASHSHDDVGSFVVGLGREQPVGDPGGPAQYERGTFSSQRRTYKVINSFGHPVPVIAGQMQVDATTVKPKVLRTRFAPERDEITIDLAPVYSVTGVKKLERTMVFDRTGKGKITVEDAFEFVAPTSFETALPTHARFRQIDGGTLEFAIGGQRLFAKIDAPTDYIVDREPIDDTAPPAIRVAIRLKAPVTSGSVRLTFGLLDETK